MCSDLTTTSEKEQLIRPDPMLLIALALFGAFALLYLFPLPPQSVMFQIEYYWAEFGLISLVIILFYTALRRAADTAARKFWTLMTAAFCCWWLAGVCGFLIRSDSPWLYDFIKDILLLAVSCLVVVAADLRLGMLKSSMQSLQARMTAISSVLVIVGVFGYIALVPALTGMQDYESPFLVYAVLDAYIALRFVIQGLRTESDSWRGLLLLTGGAFVLITIADLLVVGFDSGTLQYRPGQPLNLVWFLFYIPMFLASRVSTDSPRASAMPATTGDSAMLNPAPMMAYGVALPLIHLGGYGLGDFDESSRMARDLFVLVWLLGASAALVWQYFLLRNRLRYSEVAQLAARKEAADLQDQLRRGQRIELAGQLSGGIAHEFGNSLFGAESLAQKILRDVQRPGASVNEANASGLVNALAGSRELIRKFKSLGRGDDTESSVVNVVDEVKSTLELLRSGISREVTLEFVCDIDDIAAIARKQDLQQITLNLVLNARDSAGDHGRITVQVVQSEIVGQTCSSCGVRVSGNQVCLQVTDSGPGVDPAIRARLFEPLVSSKPEGKGSGLGLSIVHALVHQLQGHILLDTSPEGHCRFTVLLPSVQLEARPEPGGSSQQQHKKVLIIEEDRRIAEVFNEVPPLRQLRSNHVSSYDAALIFLQQDEQQPELVIIGNLANPVDVAALVAEARSRGIRVVMCSHRAQKSVLAALKGIDVFLDQPVNTDLFASVVVKQLAALS